MPLKKLFFLLLTCSVCLVISMSNGVAQAISIHNNNKEKIIVFGNGKIQLALNYNKKASISLLTVNGQPVIEDNAGIYSEISTKEAVYSSLRVSSDPVIKTYGHTISVTGIQYGDGKLSINETWLFTISNEHIKFDIIRTLSKAVVAEKAALPVFMFSNMNVWEGAYQDYGGLAWFYLFNKKLDTYGVHSSSSRFWNSKTGNGLMIGVAAAGRKIAMDYSRTATDKLAYRIAVSQNEMVPRFDSGTHRRRYVRDTTDVWAPIRMHAGTTHQTITLSYFDYKKQFDRGRLVGVNAEQVSAVLNTIARIGVIDKQHFGGNSWHTPYGPICLHEQYIAQMGLAINDNTYLSGYQECLDYYRDHAVLPNGRVWARWAYNNEDAMPEQFTDRGFYEARWGYLLDANPDYVTNVAELYNQTGNLTWVKTQQTACEKALEWIMKRDSNANGLVEMITDSHQQKKGSDWIDIIWASYENAFVNAKLYHALVCWADIERQLGNTSKEKYYKQFAEQLKTSFNKPATGGGFWDEENKCYIHWRDKDGSVHGNNMVTPVNFMAIAYGICDDSGRTKAMLDGIELQMQKENLFFWPICLYSYAAGEGKESQFPFPEYENGDIFLSWGSVAIKAYASYQPALALKYVQHVLAQYAKDGLAFQRYGREKQDGRGDDILSGNGLTVVGLYQAIYGINPLYNRFYLNPHITKEIAGTQVKYNYRHQSLTIDLDMNRYAVSDGRFSIVCANDFGFYSAGKELLYFHGNTNTASLQITALPKSRLELDIKRWGVNEMVFTQSSKGIAPGKLMYQINSLQANSYYTILINNKTFKRVKSNLNGVLKFEYQANKNTEEVIVLNK